MLVNARLTVGEFKTSFKHSPIHMGPSNSTWRPTSTRMPLNQFFLVLTLLQIYLQSSAVVCSSRITARTSALEEPLSPWLIPPRRALFQTVEGNDTDIIPPDSPSPGSDKDPVEESTAGQVRLALTVTIVTVNQRGTGNYATVQEAVDAVPIHNTQRVVIQIYSGTYREKIYIPSNKPFITFEGEGGTPPVVSWDDTAASANSTWASSTIAIDADNFIAIGITFENSAPLPVVGVEGGQAIALRIGGDMAAFYDCNFLGAQDTLCDWEGRHYFENCFIRGSIDFIFGLGKSLYKGCEIHSIATTSGSITAHYRQTSDDTSGYSFVECTITGTGSILLGRAWGPYSRVVFSSTNMANIITPLGWDDWGTSSYDGTVYYGEFNNSGTGAVLTERAWFSKSLTQVEADPFLTLGWIDGLDWLD